MEQSRPLPSFIGANFFLKPPVNWTDNQPTVSEGMKVTSWVVMMHSPGIGTWAPNFPSLDEAEEFANSMRLVTDNVSVSEPVPIVKTNTIKVYAREES